MTTWDDIKKEVEKNGNVATFTVEQLRNVHGSKKTGVHVREEISRQLAGMGLGHVPQELPSYQHEQVRVYKHGTPVGDLIDLVLTPGEQNDNKLVARVSGTANAADYAAIIDKIRELVCE